MKRIVNLVISLAIVFGVGGAVFSVALPTTTYAATTCTSSFLGFPAWYRGLINDDCSVKSPSDNSIGGMQNFILRIALNVLDMAMVLVGYLAVGMMLYGGFQFLTSQGAADAASKARQTMLNAAIGIIISIVAVAIVRFILSRLGAGV